MNKSNTKQFFTLCFFNVELGPIHLSCISIMIRYIDRHIINKHTFLCDTFLCKPTELSTIQLQSLLIPLTRWSILMHALSFCPIDHTISVVYICLVIFRAEKTGKEKMKNSSINFTSSVVFTNNSLQTTQSSGLLEHMEFSVHSINFLFGLPTHSYVIWLIVTGSENGVASGLFNINLSVCEIANCLNSLLTVLLKCPWFSSLTILAYFLIGLSITGRPLFQCLICVERYLAVVHPVIFLKYKPLRYRVICCTVVWIINFGSCFCCLLTLVLLNFYIYTCINSIQFLLFLCIQLFCLVAVLRALKQSGPGERGREREEENPMKRRAFFIILITTVSMAIIYMPFMISGFVCITTQSCIDETLFFGIVCFILGGFVQPVIYLHRAGKLFCP